MKLKNKKAQGGIASQHIFLFIVFAFLAIILLGIVIYGYDVVVTSLTSQELNAGAVNITNATLQTMGQINSALSQHGDLIGVLLLFGMAIGLVFGSYVTRNQNPMVLLVVDIIILIFAYVLAVYISNAYETVLGSIPFASTFTSNLSQSSSFLLLLPRMTLIIGIVIIIVAYSSIPRSQAEEVAGF